MAAAIRTLTRRVVSAQGPVRARIEVTGRSLRQSRFYMSRQTVWGKRQQLKLLGARADSLEELVVTAVRNFIGSREQVRSMLLSLSDHDSQLDRLARRSSEAGRRIAPLKPRVGPQWHQAPPIHVPPTGRGRPRYRENRS